MALKCKLWHIKNRVPHRRHLLWSRGLGNERQMGTLRFPGRSQCCCFTHLSLGLACSPGWPQTCICYFSYCCDQIPGGSNSRARGYSAHSLREHKSIMAGKHSRVHGGRKWGWEFSGICHTSEYHKQMVWISNEAIYSFYPGLWTLHVSTRHHAPKVPKPLNRAASWGPAQTHKPVGAFYV